MLFFSLLVLSSSETNFALVTAGVRGCRLLITLICRRTPPVIPLLSLILLLLLPPADVLGQLTISEMRFVENEEADEVDDVSEFEDSRELADARC